MVWVVVKFVRKDDKKECRPGWGSTTCILKGNGIFIGHIDAGDERCDGDDFTQIQFLHGLFLQCPPGLHDDAGTALFFNGIEHGEQTAVLQFHSAGITQLRREGIDIDMVLDVPGLALIF